MSFFAVRILVPSLAALTGFLLIASTLEQPSLSVVYASAKTDRTAGPTLFHEKGCEHCHGVDGVGGEKGPSLSGVGRKLKPTEIQTQILKGGEGMPAFADVLAPDEVKLLVGYLSAKKKVARTKGAPAAPAKPSPNPSTGGSDDQ